MTTRELIAQLQAADPDGTLPVCLNDGGSDVRFVCREPGYYDGPYEQLIRDASGRAIIGAKLSTRGEKVVLHQCSILLALIDRPELPVLVEVSENRREEMERRVEQWRAEAKAM